MKRLSNILSSLVIFLCTLSFVGFSQDTTALVRDTATFVQDTMAFVQDTPFVEGTPPFFEPAFVMQRELFADAPSFQTPPKSRSFSLKIPKEKKPKVATWLSVALPGAGQVYNGHWWKVPIIYAGVAGLIYMYDFNKTERDIYQAEYMYRRGDTTNYDRNPMLIPYSDQNILHLRDYYRRNIELVYIFSGLLYVLNIVDATVFAHLSAFDVSDNLSMRIQPYASPDLTPYAVHQRLPMQGGLRLTFTLK